MTDEHFSFRWGIPWLDSGYTNVPNIFFDHYVEIGVTREEFLFILHVSRYHFETARGQATPSIRTIATQLGLSRRRVQQIRARLQEKGYLKVTKREGQTNLYDCSGFALPCMEAARGRNPLHPSEEGGAKPTSRGGETHFAPGVKPTSPEEQEVRMKENNNKTPVVVSQLSDQEKARALLTLNGVSPHMADELVKTHSLPHITQAVQQANAGDHVRSIPSWIVSALKNGWIHQNSPPPGNGQAITHMHISSCPYFKGAISQPCPANDPMRGPRPWCTQCHLLENSTTNTRRHIDESTIPF